MAITNVLRPGFRFARYELLRELGAGGFGRVYAARDLSLGREVAIKLLQPEHGAREEFLQRFFQEAKAAAAIMHSGIVTVFECGRIDGTHGPADGTAFIAMEIIHGETLAARLRRVRRFGVEKAVAAVRQLAAALAAAHARGIVHRDLKPDNIFLIPDPEVAFGERIKIVDFGIAKLTESIAGDSGPRTHTTMIFGTPPYMSPEQCRSSARVDERSDIYALGCILYELICGQPPFTGDNGEVMAKQQLTPPPPPRTHAPDLAPAIEKTLLRLLAKDPAERPQTMHDVRNELGATESLPMTMPPAYAAPTATADPTRPPVTTLGSAAGSPEPPATQPTVRRSRVPLVAGATFAVALAVVGWKLAPWSSPAPSSRPAKPTIPEIVETAAATPAVPDAAPACATGQAIGPDTAGHCCWPGQAWSGSSCVGVPASCPDGWLKVAANQACELPACPGGKVRPEGTESCCWPGQVWSRTSNRCIGQPTCPEPLVVFPEEETCRHACIGTWKGRLTNLSDANIEPWLAVVTIETVDQPVCGTYAEIKEPYKKKMRCTFDGETIRSNFDGYYAIMKCKGDQADFRITGSDSVGKLKRMPPDPPKPATP